MFDMPPRPKSKSTSKPSGKAKKAKAAPALDPSPFKRGVGPVQIVIRKSSKPAKRDPKLNKSIRDTQAGLPQVSHVQINVGGVMRMAQLDKLGRVRKIS